MFLNSGIPWTARRSNTSILEEISPEYSLEGLMLKLGRPSLVAQPVKCLPAMQETWVQSLGQEDLLEKEMSTHASILAWKIPWIEEPGRLQSMGSQRVGHYWTTLLTLLMLKLKLQYLATWCEKLTHLKRPWFWERLKVEREDDNRGWDGWIASLTQCIWVWLNSESWWWMDRRPGLL